MLSGEKRRTQGSSCFSRTPSFTLTLHPQGSLLSLGSPPHPLPPHDPLTSPFLTSPEAPRPAPPHPAGAPRLSPITQLLPPHPPSPDRVCLSPSPRPGPSLTDLLAAAGALRAAVQDVCEQLGLEGGGGALLPQVRVHRHRGSGSARSRYRYRSRSRSPPDPAAPAPPPVTSLPRRHVGADHVGARPSRGGHGGAVSAVLLCSNRAGMCMELRRESARHMRHRHGVVSYRSSSLNAVGYALNAVLHRALDLRVKGCAWGWACSKCPYSKCPCKVLR